MYEYIFIRYIHAFIIIIYIMHICYIIYHIIYSYTYDIYSRIYINYILRDNILLLLFVVVNIILNYGPGFPGHQTLSDKNNYFFYPPFVLWPQKTLSGSPELVACFHSSHRSPFRKPLDAPRTRGSGLQSAWLTPMGLPGLWVPACCPASSKSREAVSSSQHT